MFPKQRLIDLEKSLELRYETVSEARKRLAITDEIFAKTAIKQRLREEVLPELRREEVEYWELLRQVSYECDIQETDAQDAIVKVVTQIDNSVEETSPEQMVRLLREIRDKLKEPGNAASAKAKLALSLIPGVLAYEIELDTENTLRKAFQPLKNLFQEAIEKK